jgi:capsular polysaccharide biosynthesis protein
MAGNQITKYRFESFDLISFAIARFKLLFIITVIGAIVSIIVSLSITEKYKSTIILFPASSSSVSNDLFGRNLSKKDILKFGEEEEVEQMMQVLQSDDIRTRIIEKYNLLDHYDIDTASNYPLTQLYKEYESNISIKRTEYMSVKIDVLDIDPEIAANIANDMASLVDTVMNKMQKERAKKAFVIVEKEYLALEWEIGRLEDSLVVLRNFGVIDYESQAEVISRAWAEAVTAGNTTGAKKLEKKLDVFAKYGGAYVSIRDQLEFEKKELVDVKSKYMEAKVDSEQDLPFKFIVNKAVKAEKKSYPVRWLIVVVSTMSTFILALMLLLIFESVKKVEENN